MVQLIQTSKNVCLPLYQLVQLWFTMCAVSVQLIRRNNSQGRYVVLLAVQTSGNVWLHVFNIFYTVASCCFIVNFSVIGKCLRSCANCSTDQNQCVLSYVYSCVLYPSVSVSSPAAGSLFTIFYFGRMQNNENLKFFPNPFCSCFI